MRERERDVERSREKKENWTSIHKYALIQRERWRTEINRKKNRHREIDNE